MSRSMLSHIGFRLLLIVLRGYTIAVKSVSYPINTMNLARSSGWELFQYRCQHRRVNTVHRCVNRLIELVSFHHNVAAVSTAEWKDDIRVCLGWDMGWRTQQVHETLSVELRCPDKLR
jgi:hypothetical protein